MSIRIAAMDVARDFGIRYGHSVTVDSSCGVFIVYGLPIAAIDVASNF